jgi:hypothetical protein
MSTATLVRGCTRRTNPHRDHTARPGHRRAPHPLGMCESCRNVPATTTWANPRAGAPFALCQSCAALVPTPNPAPRRRQGR